MVTPTSTTPLFDSLVIETKGKRRVPNEFGKPQRPRQSMDAAWDAFRQHWPNLQRRSADSTYNCYGLAFANRRTAVTDTALPIIFQDDGYRVITRTNALPGDVVVYRDQGDNITHVAIVLQRRLVISEDQDDLVVVSQWGFDGEYIHPASEVPLQYGSAREIWTERRI